MNNDVSWLYNKVKEVNDSEKPIKSIMALFIEGKPQLDETLGVQLNVITRLNEQTQQVVWFRQSINSSHWATHSTYHEKMLARIMKEFFNNYGQANQCHVYFFLSQPNVYQFPRQLVPTSHNKVPLHS